MQTKNIKTIKYVVVDVDGTLTDSGIYYDEQNNEIKKFSTRDAAGFFALKECGIKTIIITGRESSAVKKRLLEMKADYIFQNIKVKYEFLKEFMQQNNIKSEQILYVGDDLNDLSAMTLCDFIACPIDACKEIKAKSDFISDKKGGDGAFRDVIEQMLTKLNLWEDIISKIYQTGV